MMPALVGLPVPLYRIGAAGLAAVLSVVLLTPFVIWGARRRGWVAVPSDDEWHETPTALLGGIAIFTGVAGTLVSSGSLGAFPKPVWVGAVLIFGTGLADDLWTLRPTTKLVAQAACATLVLSSGLLFGHNVPLWIAGSLTVVWVLGLTNALNLLDAMDGVASGVGAIAALSFGLVAVLQGFNGLAAVAGILAAAAGGFLVFNFPPARIFMGDCGSLFLGYMLALLGLGIQGSDGGALSSPLLPILVLSVPLFDTTFVSVTRLLRGQPVTEGGTDHTMHRLVRLGLTERQTVLLLYGVGGLGGGLALSGLFTSSSTFHTLFLGAVGAAGAAGLFLASRSPAQSVAEPDREPSDSSGL